MIKHHPQNRRERLLLNKRVKFGNLPIKDRPGHVRRKLAREKAEVEVSKADVRAITDGEELNHEFREVALGALPEEISPQEPVA